MLRLTWEDGESIKTSLADFLEANADDPDACSSVSALACGQQVVLGGGAAPYLTVTHEADTEAN